MNLKKLTIHNIASLADAEIDFAGDILSQSTIFLIAGETGAGKSTILDSICLALYDDTPRMSAMSREDIGQNDSNGNPCFANDNSQFLRRGAGEGFARLIFTAADGKDYEAVWAVQRNHRKPTGRLQRSRRSLRALDNSYQETRKPEIKDKVRELTGMDYEQFCRTVMLAQGEFTKFLKSEKNDKSQILEKLTGTRIYSEIGKMIATHYLESKARWENLHREVEMTVLLTEEEKEVKNDRKVTLEKETESLMRKLEETGLKLKWISDLSSLMKKKRQKEDSVAKLEERMASQDFKDKENLIADYDATSEVRMAYTERLKLRSVIEKAEKSIPELSKKLEADKGKAVVKGEEIDKVKTALREKEKTAEEYDLQKLNMTVNGLHARLRKFQNLKDASQRVASAETSITETENVLNEERNEEKVYSEQVILLAEDEERARTRLGEISSDLEKVTLSTSEAIETLRGILRVGDECPVCGKTIDTVLGDNVMAGMLAPLSERKAEAEKNLTDIIAKRKAAVRISKDLAKRIKSTADKLADLLTNIEKERNLLAACKEVCCLDIDDTVMLQQAAENRITGIENELKGAIENQKRGEKILGAIDKLNKSAGKLMEEKSRLMENVSKSEIALNLAMENLRGQREKEGELTYVIEAFFAENRQIDAETLDSLCSITRRDIDKSRKKITETTQALASERGAVAALGEQIEALNTSRPDFHEEETHETLEAAQSETQERITELHLELGQIGEQLRRDETMRKSLEQKLGKEEEAREEKEKWEGLYNLLGDANGTKFRNVAQSFILRSLLESANHYMRNFTDRYSLTCNAGSLAILVRDCYRPSDPQPASILSGGESFMASLSLALALSGLKSGGTGADILFIDEGFGTLSAEYLENVMDTLEKLHRMGGRKVGLISHVPEMKERIPVQIHVRRESPALSKIEIIGG